MSLSIEHVKHSTNLVHFTDLSCTRGNGNEKRLYGIITFFFIVSCSAWERGQAKTVEQKRDFY